MRYYESACRFEWSDGSVEDRLVDFTYVTLIPGTPGRWEPPRYREIAIPTAPEFLKVWTTDEPVCVKYESAMFERIPPPEGLRSGEGWRYRQISGPAPRLLRG